MNPLFVLGPGDRFNYGDLLFPHVIKHTITEVSNQIWPIRNFGLVQSNLSGIGAIPTFSYRQLLQSIENKEPSSGVLISGGECLSADRHLLYGFIQPYYRNLRANKLFRKLDELVDFTKTFGGIKENYPFSFYKEGVKTLYNSVGGSGLKYLPLLQRNGVLAKLEKAEYLAVRDKATYDFIASHFSHNLFLVPDSAILMNKIFATSFLEEKADVKLKEMLSTSFVFLQLSHSKTKGYKKIILNQLKILKKKIGLPFVALPIGKAPGHEDHRILKDISEQIDDFYFFESPCIFDIMYAISKCSLYLGTSLHGFITASCFDRPFVMLGRQQSKVVNYLNTWHQGQEHLIADYHEIAEVAILRMKHEALSGNIQKMQAQVYDSFRRMVSIIGK